VLPDPVAKVSVLHLDQPPERVEDLDRVIRFQMRKAAPFAIDDAQLCWLPGISQESQRDYIVSMARRDVVQEYEHFCTAAGAHPGVVDLATFNVANAVLAEKARAGDWLLVNAAGAYVSIAILRGSHLVFFRSRTADADDSIADMVHQTAMYYEDRLEGLGFARVILRGSATESGSDRIRQSLEARLSVDIQSIDPRGAVGAGESIDAPAMHLDALAPVVGLLVRGKAAA
jgi:Tfp pilus assembly PilM family ATPase